MTKEVKATKPKLPKFKVAYYDFETAHVNDEDIPNESALQSAITALRADPTVGTIAVYALQTAEQRQTTFKSIL